MGEHAVHLEAVQTVAGGSHGEVHALARWLYARTRGPQRGALAPRCTGRNEWFLEAAMEFPISRLGRSSGFPGDPARTHGTDGAGRRAGGRPVRWRPVQREAGVFGK